MALSFAQTNQPWSEKLPNPTNTPSFPTPGGTLPNYPGSGLVSTGSGCEYACANCSIFPVVSTSGVTLPQPGLCIECIRCYIANGLKLIGVDLLLAALLLMGIYLLFQKQINVTVRTAARGAATAAAA